LEPFCTFRGLKLFDLYQKSFRWTAFEIKSIKGPDEIREPPDSCVMLKTRELDVVGHF
jgi:hypothetical protein